MLGILEKLGIKTNIFNVLLFSTFTLLFSIKTLWINLKISNSGFDIIIIYRLLSSISIIFLLSIAFQKRYMIILFYLISLTWIYLNLIYFNYYLRYLTPHVILTNAKEGITAGIPLIWSISRIVTIEELLIPLIDLPLFTIITANFPAIRNIIQFMKRKIIIIILLFMLFLTLIIKTITLIDQNKEIIYKIIEEKRIAYSEETFIVKNYGSVANFLIKLLLYPTEKEIIQLFDYGPKKEFSPLGVHEKISNIIIIQVESLDSSIIRYKHNDIEITPFLNRLSELENVIFFRYCISFHKAGSTSDAEFSVINSTEPLDFYPSMKLANFEKNDNLPKILRKNGYKTYAFHNNDGNFFGRSDFYTRTGFDNFFDVNKMKLPSQQYWGSPDHKMFEFVEKYITQRKKKNLFYIITMSSHIPFDFVNEYFTNENLKNIEETYLKNYFNSISYIDTTLSNFISKTLERTDSTLIVIYGDHASGVYSDKYKSAKMNISNKFFIELVPLFIVLPKSLGHLRKEIDTQNIVSFLDISPTLLSLVVKEKFEIRTYGCNILEKTFSSENIPLSGHFLDRKKIYKTMVKMYGK